MPVGFARHIYTLAQPVAVHRCILNLSFCRHNSMSTMQHIGSSALQSMRTGAAPAPAHGLSGVRTMLCPHTQRVFGGVLAPAVQQAAVLGGAHGIHQSRIIAQAAAVVEGGYLARLGIVERGAVGCALPQQALLLAQYMAQYTLCSHTHSSPCCWHQSARRHSQHLHRYEAPTHDMCGVCSNPTPVVHNNHCHVIPLPRIFRIPSPTLPQWRTSITAKPHWWIPCSSNPRCFATTR